MELSSPRIKKFLILYNHNLKIFPWKKVSYILEKFIIFSQKDFFLYFRKWNFLSLRWKRILYFLKKAFLIFRKMKLSSSKIKNFQERTFWVWKIKQLSLKIFVIFQEMKLSSPKLNFYIFSWKGCDINFGDECWSRCLFLLKVNLYI